nr:hypothetical protein [uncultured Acetatifactor sp.]
MCYHNSVSFRDVIYGFQQLHYTTNREEIFIFSNKRIPYLCGFWRFANAYINNDKKDDVIIITYYVSGAGPTGMVPRPGVTIYLAGENEFCLAEDMIADAEENISQKDMKNLKMMLL